MVSQVPYPTPTEAPTCVPIPPRYWWLKRIAVFAVVLLAVMAMARWRWGVYAQRTLRAEIDRLEAAGVPIRLDQLMPPPIPDDQNAAVVLRNAASLLNLSQDQQKAMKAALAYLRDFARQDQAILQTIVDDTIEARGLVRQARSMDSVDWGIDCRTMNFGQQWLGATELLAVLETAAILAHEAGNDREAFETIRDVIAFGRHLGEARFELACVVHADCTNKAATLAEHVLGMTQPPRPTEPRVAPVMRQLIRDLLDEQPLRQSVKWALCQNRWWHSDVIREIELDPSLLVTPQAGLVSTSLAAACGRLLMPAYELDCARWLRQDAQYLLAIESDSHPQFLERRPQGGPLSRTAWIMQPFTAYSQYTVDKPLWTALARTRMAAIALAIRLYETDQGSMPSSLDELVPRYLDSLAADPYTSDGAPFTYAPHAEFPYLQTAGELSNYPSKLYLKGKPPKKARTASRPG